MAVIKKNNYIYKGCQLVIYSFCIIGFAINVSVTFKSFIEDETIQSAESKIPQDKLYLPSFAVCPGTPFRNESKLMLTLEEYDENAYDPTELDVTILYVFKTLDVKYKEEILRTSVLGKCLYYEMEDKVDWTQVMASDYLLINIGGANKTGFEFLVMNRLDRLSFHIDFVMSKLENSNFLRFTSDHKHGVVSFPLRMTHYHDQTGVDCNSEVNTEDQRDCLAKFLYDMNDEKFGCFTPLTLSMFGNRTEQKEYKMCSLEAYLKSTSWIDDGHWFDQFLNVCSNPCQEQSFKSRPKLEKRTEVFCKPEYPCMSIHPAIGSKKVTYYTLKYTVGWNDLISSVGGGLGLFLGFSIWATSTNILDYFFKHK